LLLLSSVCHETDMEVTSGWSLEQDKLVCVMLLDFSQDVASASSQRVLREHCRWDANAGSADPCRDCRDQRVGNQPLQLLQRVPCALFVPVHRISSVSRCVRICRLSGRTSNVSRAARGSRSGVQTSSASWNQGILGNACPSE